MLRLLIVFRKIVNIQVPTSNRIIWKVEKNFKIIHCLILNDVIHLKNKLRQMQTNSNTFNCVQLNFIHCIRCAPKIFVSFARYTIFCRSAYNTKKSSKQWHGIFVPIQNASSLVIDLNVQYQQQSTTVRCILLFFFRLQFLLHQFTKRQQVANK